MDANKLANTRRDIVNKKRLTDMEIQAIKDKVTDKTDCTENNSCHEDNPSAAAVEDNALVARDEVAVQTDKEQLNDPNVPETRQHTNDGDEAAMMEEILRKWEIVKESKITERPPISKIKHTTQAKEVLETANKAINLIKAKKGQNLSLTEVNEL